MAGYRALFVARIPSKADGVVSFTPGLGLGWSYTLYTKGVSVPCQIYIELILHFI